MKKERRRRKKPTIFKIFLIPLITIMLIQSIITIGTLIVRRTTAMLEAYSIGMMNRLVENRGVVLQNDMNQRWASVYEQEDAVTEVVKEFLDSKGIGIQELLGSSDRKNELLEQLFEECFRILQNNSPTGIFLILTGDDMEGKGSLTDF